MEGWVSTSPNALRDTIYAPPPSDALLGKAGDGGVGKCVWG
jgi:hypothetical protein